MLDTGQEWVTAGGSGGETSTITALVKNGSSPLPGGVTVLFSMDNLDGTISPAQAVTGIDGKATAIFKPGTRSGGHGHHSDGIA
ncbi:Ig-like domain-containing protein [Methanoculleus chikugoensis]|uniref:Ig-like domain-containing protein n=1 Tax=Methanoculleus chikugoensis TaxID=118126 RepID=UPI0006CFDB87|nr:Ig-like domain-containing protein [Methanoculleus chikugoensis]